MNEVGVELPVIRLTAEQEVELAKTIEAGVVAREVRRTGGFRGATDTELIMLEEEGARALTRFVDANLRLVAMVARKEATRCVLAVSELFQEGCLGLLAAAMRFDHRKGYRFSTYALHWIRAQINAVTANRNGELNLPAGRAERIRQLHGETAELAQRLGRTVSDADLAAATGNSRTWVAAARIYQRPQSLEEALLDGNEVIDLDATEEFDRVLKSAIPGRELLARLSALQRRVIEFRYGFVDSDHHTYSETAHRLGLPISTVRRTELRALEALRGVCPHQARALL